MLVLQPCISGSTNTGIAFASQHTSASTGFGEGTGALSTGVEYGINCLPAKHAPMSSQLFSSTSEQDRGWPWVDAGSYEATRTPVVPNHLEEDHRYIAIMAVISPC
jgi:hypothetical protein